MTENQDDQATGGAQVVVGDTAAPSAPVATESAAQAAPADTGGITWTASEFVAHEKSAAWYAVLIAVAAVIGAILYWLTRDYITIGVVVVCAAAFWYYAGRQPRQLTYHIDDKGIVIGQRHFVYEQFRSFSIVPEGAFSSIVFMPLKRFAPLTTIYYPPESEQQIIDFLAPRLPQEDYKHDAVERLMLRIRF